MVLVDHLGELTDHQGHGLHPLDLFLRADHLALQVLHLLRAWGEWKANLGVIKPGANECVNGTPLGCRVGIEGRTRG